MNLPPNAPDRPLRRRRPAVVSWLAAGVLILGVFYLTRFVLSLRLPDLPLSVPEWYLPLTGAVWAAACLAIGIGLWRGSRTAYRLLHWAAPLYLAWYWIDRVVFVRSDFAQRSLPAALLMTIAAAGVITLVVRRRSVRSYFAEASDG